MKPISAASGGPPAVAPASSATPTHGTSMAATMLRSLGTATKGKTSVRILPVDVYGANQARARSTSAMG